MGTVLIRCLEWSCKRTERGLHVWEPIFKRVICSGNMHSLTKQQLFLLLSPWDSVSTKVGKVAVNDLFLLS